MKYLRCSIELWLHFIAYSIREIARRRSPLSIQASDTVARELFNNHIKSNGKLELNAFLVSERSGYGISLHRWSKARRRLFVCLGLSRNRPPLKFRGFALFEANALSQVRTTPLRVAAAPTAQNPFHANIGMPPGREKSYYMLIASEFVKQIKPRTDLLSNQAADA